jgi:hypothetical protein
MHSTVVLTPVVALAYASSKERALGDPLEEHTWLYRGVPAESPEVGLVKVYGAVAPRRPGLVGEYARYCHSINEMTDTGYTSWTTNRDIAEELGRFTSDEAALSGIVVIFRVRISTIERDRVFEGQEREDEYLIEGTVEDVEVSEDTDEDD